MFARGTHARIYVIALACMAASLPLSEFTTSISLIVLISNWVLEGRFREKFTRFRKRRSLWYIFSVYLLFVVGMLYTSDLQYGLHDLRIKAPFLALPLIIGTSDQISAQQLKWILRALAAGVLIGSLSSMAVVMGLVNRPYRDMHEISLFISHIRFSLMIDLAIFSLFYLICTPSARTRSWELPVYLLVMTWLVVFLFILQSVTGILLFFGVFFVLFWIYLHRFPNIVFRWALSVFVIISIVTGISLLSRSISNFYHVETIDPEQLESETVNGNPYYHDLDKTFLENGNYIWLYICEPELEREWNKRSSLPYDGEDRHGNEIRRTLIRYLTSRGLRKDSLGLAQLSAEDIAMIERGKANYLYGRKFSLYPKIYNILWQIDVYRKGGNPSGHSVTQRILYLEAALGIIGQHFWTGVGTGDVRQAYEQYYREIDSPLDDRWRLRAHNQFLTFMVTYGVIGLAWILFSLLYPVFLEKKWTDYFMLVFLMISMGSMLNEDTLETHTGLTFFAFFYALFLLATKPSKL